MNKSVELIEEQPAPAPIKTPSDVLFGDYVREWLSVKEKTVKPSTLKEYIRLCNHDLIPAFGEKKLSEIDRATLQKYLFSFLDEGKERTADKLKLLLTCIFNVVAWYTDFSKEHQLKEVAKVDYEL